MPFLLGSFTDGLFGGASSAEDIATKWETLKQQRIQTQREQRMEDAIDTVGRAKADQAALDAANSTLPTGTVENTAPAARTPYTDADLEALPKPKWMQALGNVGKGGMSVSTEPPPGSTSTRSSSAGKGGMSVSTEPSPGSTPTQAGGASDALPLTWSPSSGLHRAAPGESGLSWSPSSGLQYTPAPQQALPVGDSSNPATAPIPPRTTPPQYLPQQNTTGGGADNTPATAPIPSPGPTSMIGGGAPNLANGQTGIGAQILAALNPTAGKSA